MQSIACQSDTEAPIDRSAAKALDSQWNGRTPPKARLKTARHWGMVGDEPTEGSANGKAELCRIAEAAERAGMTVDLLEAGILRGQIPVILRYIGRGNRRFIHIGQLEAWLNERPPVRAPGLVVTPPNLFE
jgi:hypothetical protein